MCSAYSGHSTRLTVSFTVVLPYPVCGELACHSTRNARSRLAMSERRCGGIRLAVSFAIVVPYPDRREPACYSTRNARSRLAMSERSDGGSPSMRCTYSGHSTRCFLRYRRSLP
jgi:hypothetical protein